MLFKKNGFVVIKNVLEKGLIEFLYDYCISRRNNTQYLIKNRLISMFDKDWGVFGDGQVDTCFSMYGDCALDQLLPKLKTLIEKQTKSELIENYSYMRVYEKGDKLTSHLDRTNCKFSITLNIGGAIWPIYIKIKNKTHKIILNPGDILIYDGTKNAHWREELKDDHCVQVFLHYHDKKDPNVEKLKYDGRPMIGALPWTRIHEVPTK